MFKYYQLILQQSSFHPNLAQSLTKVPENWQKKMRINVSFPSTSRETVGGANSPEEDSVSRWCNWKSASQTSNKCKQCGKHDGNTAHTFVSCINLSLLTTPHRSDAWLVKACVRQDLFTKSVALCRILLLSIHQLFHLGQEEKTF